MFGRALIAQRQAQRASIHANLRFVHCYFEARLPKLEGAADSSARLPAWKVGHCFESAGEPAAKSLTRASVRYASCFAEDSRRSFRATIFEALTDPFARKKTNKVKFHTDFVLRAFSNLGLCLPSCPPCRAVRVSARQLGPSL